MQKSLPVNIIKKYWPTAMIALQKYKQVVLTLMALAILGDILFMPGSSDIRIFSLLAIYISAVRFYRIKSVITFYWCLILLLLMFMLFLLRGPAPDTEKTAVWLFLFMMIGVIQQWREP